MNTIWLFMAVASINYCVYCVSICSLFLLPREVMGFVWCRIGIFFLDFSVLKAMQYIELLYKNTIFTKNNCQNTILCSKYDGMCQTDLGKILPAIKNIVCVDFWQKNHHCVGQRGRREANRFPIIPYFIRFRIAV